MEFCKPTNCLTELTQTGLLHQGLWWCFLQTWHLNRPPSKVKHNLKRTVFGNWRVAQSVPVASAAFDCWELCVVCLPLHQSPDDRRLLLRVEIAWLRLIARLKGSASRQELVPSSAFLSLDQICSMIKNRNLRALEPDCAAKGEIWRALKQTIAPRHPNYL